MDEIVHVLAWAGVAHRLKRLCFPNSALLWLIAIQAPSLHFQGTALHMDVSCRSGAGRRVANIFCVRA
jgi:hypothetical protein